MKTFSVAKNVLNYLCEQGRESMFAGGCVRDLMLKKIPHDFDIATTARPEEMLLFLQSRNFSKKFPNIRAVIPTGIEHGTVSLVLQEMTLEITTLRQDVKTDGRHAVVEFGRSFEEDAKRRDFTVNALYLNKDGKILDFVSGKKDLKRKVLRFVGDPKTRIKEDSLRVLRLFRFWSQLSFTPEIKSLSACVKNARMTKNLSRERVNAEWQKLLIGKNFSKPLRLILKQSLHQYFFPNFSLHPKIGKFNGAKVIKFLSLVDVDLRFAAWFCLHKNSQKAFEFYKISRKNILLVDLVGDLLMLAEKKQTTVEYLETTYKMQKKYPKETWEEGFKILKALIKSHFSRVSEGNLKKIFTNEMKVAKFRKIPIPFDGHSIMKKYGLKPGPEVEKRLSAERLKFFRGLITWH